MDNKDVEYEKLYSLSKKFRNIVDKCVDENRDLFSDFPHGYCAQVSIWAYDYLTSKGYKNIEFRNRDPFFQDRVGNHVWLNWRGYNIDLSSDQFSKGNEVYASVIITKDDNSLENRYTTDYEVTDRFYRVRMEYLPVCSSDEQKKLKLIYNALGLEFSY